MSAAGNESEVSLVKLLELWKSISPVTLSNPLRSNCLPLHFEISEQSPPPFFKEEIVSFLQNLSPSLKILFVGLALE